MTLRELSFWKAPTDRDLYVYLSHRTGLNNAQDEKDVAFGKPRPFAATLWLGVDISDCI